MKRKIIGCLLTGVLFLTLTGCGNNNNSNNENEIDTPNNNSTDTNEIDNNSLYSDETKIVFNMQDVYYLVYHHNGNEITGLDFVYDYSDKNTAKQMIKIWQASYKEDDTVESIELKGKQIVVKFKESAYYYETVESVKQRYSYLEEMKKN